MTNLKGGKYVPACANAILDNPRNFNFKSLIIGDPLIDPYLQGKKRKKRKINININNKNKIKKAQEWVKIKFLKFFFFY